MLVLETLKRADVDGSSEHIPSDDTNGV